MKKPQKNEEMEQTKLAEDTEILGQTIFVTNLGYLIRSL